MSSPAAHPSLIDASDELAGLAAGFAFVALPIALMAPGALALVALVLVPVAIVALPVALLAGLVALPVVGARALRRRLRPMRRKSALLTQQPRRP